MTQVVNTAPSSFLIMVSAVVYQKIASTHVKNKNIKWIISMELDIPGWNTILVYHTNIN